MDGMNRAYVFTLVVYGYKLSRVKLPEQRLRPKSKRNMKWKLGVVT